MSPQDNQSHDNRFSSQFINLAEARLGAVVLYATDDFFAEKENLIKPGRGIFIPDKYTPNGKWMDGWESRRKRVPGHDWCDIRLGASGIIHGLDIDTNHFLGNHPSEASVEACCIIGDPNETTTWTEILPKSPLNRGSQNLFAVTSTQRWTHVRLHIYPDGGVARLRVYGKVHVDWNAFAADALVDLASVMNGGRAVQCNDMFFSSMNNINAPGRGINMGDGWETKRRRGPGHDWLILALGRAGRISRIDVDTHHFKGNYPDSCTIEAAALDVHQDDGFDNVDWQPLLERQKLEAHRIHSFSGEVKDTDVITHVRLNIFPDGGVSRLRLWGKPQ